jgi:DNA sulfur modification protein DndB
MQKLFIPALRGVFGDWVYYSCLMPAQVVAKQVSFAEELNKSKKLSELIQREIKKKRGLEIARYLINENERFFNSLVVAVWGGSPDWFEFGIKSQNKEVSVDDIPDYALHSFGFIHFAGGEKLFALDGQHRLAGIKKVFEDGKSIADEISVILVAHMRTKKGVERSRRLFTTLNKTAIPVSKGERIALDENDVMAITVRRMVEENPMFDGDRIAYQATNNLAINDLKSLTTIGNLYDVLSILFSKIVEKKNLKELQYNRPDDDALEQYYKAACNFFDLLQAHIPEFKAYFKSKDYTQVVKRHRGKFGGSVVFRPLGLTIYTEAIQRLSTNRSLSESIELVARIPRELSAKPFADVLWDTRKKVIVTKGKVLARDLMLYMLRENSESDRLRRDYALALGQEVDEVTLPRRV